jgi:type VI secretion system protein ImpA
VTVAGRPADLYGRALAEARAGRPDRGVELLSQALEQETSRRGRFLRQTELSGVMVRGGLEAVARPILEELVQQIDNQSLEQWEEPGVVAAPLALLYRVIGKIDGDTSERQTLYQRVCKLDPVAAVALTREESGAAEVSETSTAGAW